MRKADEECTRDPWHRHVSRWGLPRNGNCILAGDGLALARLTGTRQPQRA